MLIANIVYVVIIIYCIYPAAAAPSKNHIEAELPRGLVLTDHWPPFSTSQFWVCIQPNGFVLWVYE